MDKRKVIVTGAASGIGAAVAAMLAGDWQVIGLDQAYTDISAHNDSGFLKLACDVSDEASVRSVFSEIGARHGTVDAIVCAAGVLATGGLMEMSVADFDRLFAINTRGAWLTARSGVELMRKRPVGAVGGRVVFLGSISGIRPKVGGGAYGAQKSALHVLTGVMAAELAGEGILVNAVAPGTVDTPMIQAVTSKGGDTSYRPSGTSPLGRVAEAEDIANVVLFLLEEQSTYVTGTVLPVDGGTRAAFVPPS